MNHTVHAGLVVALAVAALSLTPTGGAAQSASVSPSVRQGVAAVPPRPVTAAPAEDLDADQTRAQFIAVLGKYPPSLGRVLKLDPSLMTNETYLAPYPALGAFLAQHPEVVRNPAFFLESVNTAGYEYSRIDQGTLRRREIGAMLGAFAAFLTFLTVTGVIIWLVRTVVESRRWNRVSKTHFDVHSKLLERFSTNEELLAYIQTPVGRRFLESGPAPLAGESRPMGAPISRILWSVQAGVVLAISAAGLLFLSWRMGADDASLFFMVVGVVTLALGGGFMASGAAAYVLSRRLGLLDSSDSGHA